MRLEIKSNGHKKQRLQSNKFLPGQMLWGDNFFMKSKNLSNFLKTTTLIFIKSSIFNCVYVCKSFFTFNKSTSYVYMTLLNKRFSKSKEINFRLEIVLLARFRDYLFLGRSGHSVFPIDMGGGKRFPHTE